LRDLFEIVRDRGTRHKVGEASLRKTDKLVGEGALPEMSKALEAHDLIAGLQRQGDALPGRRRSEPCLPGFDKSTEGSSIVAPYRIKPSVCPISLTASHVGSTSRLANDQLLGFEHVQGSPESPQTDVEFTMKVHLTWKGTSGFQRARSDAVKHGVANL
jgi:hypothetical protein